MQEGRAPQPDLVEAVTRWDLSRHPFWSEWRAGAVPLPGLAALSRVLSTVLPMLQRGWELLNDMEHAELAGHFVELWHRFAIGVESRSELVHLTQLEELETQTRHWLLKDATALGALYAIHHQLPFIARELRDTLERFHATEAGHAQPFCQYALEQAGLGQLLERYFANYSQSQQLAASGAAEREASALWNAITGVHSSYSAPAR